MPTLAQANALLSSLKVGDPVTLTLDGRPVEVTVQRELSGRDPGGYGNPENFAVTVGFGPGRFNTEVTPARMAAGYVALSLPKGS